MLGSGFCLVVGFNVKISSVTKRKRGWRFPSGYRAFVLLGGRWQLLLGCKNAPDKAVVAWGVLLYRLFGMDLENPSKRQFNREVPRCLSVVIVFVYKKEPSNPWSFFFHVFRPDSFLSADPPIDKPSSVRLCFHGQLGWWDELEAKDRPIHCAKGAWKWFHEFLWKQVAGVVVFGNRSTWSLIRQIYDGI